MKIDYEKGGLSATTVALVIVIGIVALIGLAYLNNQPNGLAPVSPEAGIGGGPADDQEGLIADIANNPDNYFGKAVTVTGEVESVRGERVFVLEEEDGIFDEQVLVVVSGTLPQRADRTEGQPFAEGDKVTITGTVRQMTVEQIEMDTDIDLSQEVESEFADRSVIVADSVTLGATETDEPNPSAVPTDNQIGPVGEEIFQD